MLEHVPSIFKPDICLAFRTKFRVFLCFDPTQRALWQHKRLIVPCVFLFLRTMHRAMSYRKPVPAYIPSPPSSPVSLSTFQHASRQKEEMPPLPEDWHDAIAQARTILSSASFAHAQPAIDEAPQLPKLASPVHLASKNHRRIYRPPTPPRPSDHEWRGPPGLDLESFEVALNRRTKLIDLPGRGFQRTDRWSIGTGEFTSHRESGISWASTEWEVAQRPTDGMPQEQGHAMWWERIKTLGVLIKNRMKGFKEYGAWC
ncbi:hypothetical protein C8F04DRAFT_1748 [Mycena alexandri]|uniref:Uncharacterized protein n=1 Tax=Mycena alexandri TaxID=1745969 RepID=A0AAD6TNA9_9AGAR|nr:hypothetical protein C8F04DRAFT_1748 [Mycena alexandri]